MYLSQTSVPVRSTLRHDHERDRENKTNRTINHPGHGGTDARAIPVPTRRVITGPSRTLRPPASAVPAALGSGSGPSAAETRPLLPRIGRRGCSARSAQRGERGMDSRGVAPYYGHGCTWTVGYECGKVDSRLRCKRAAGVAHVGSLHGTHGFKDRVSDLLPHGRVPARLRKPRDLHEGHWQCSCLVQPGARSRV